MGMEHDLVEKLMAQKAIRTLHRTIDLMAAELAEALPNKPYAGDTVKWIRYAEATIESEERQAKIG